MCPARHEFARLFGLGGQWLQNPAERGGNGVFSTRWQQNPDTLDEARGREA